MENNVIRVIDDNNIEVNGIRLTAIVKNSDCSKCYFFKEFEPCGFYDYEILGFTSCRRLVSLTWVPAPYALKYC